MPPAIPVLLVAVDDHLILNGRNVADTDHSEHSHPVHFIILQSDAVKNLFFHRPVSCRLLIKPGHDPFLSVGKIRHQFSFAAHTIKFLRSTLPHTKCTVLCQQIDVSKATGFTLQIHPALNIFDRLAAIVYETLLDLRKIFPAYLDISFDRRLIMRRDLTDRMYNIIQDRSVQLPDISKCDTKDNEQRGSDQQ